MPQLGPSYTQQVGIALHPRIAYALWALSLAEYGPCRLGEHRKGLAHYCRLILHNHVSKRFGISSIDELPDPPAGWTPRKLSKDEPAPECPIQFSPGGAGTGASVIFLPSAFELVRSVSEPQLPFADLAEA